MPPDQPDPLVPQETLYPPPSRAPGPFSPKAGEEFINRFLIMQLLGEGGMASVWLASDKLRNKLVALKFPSLNKSQNAAFTINRLKKEVDSVSVLSHDNIVHINDLFADPGAPDSCAISMEYVKGLTLVDWRKKRADGSVDENGFVDPDALLPVARQICDALAYAHRKNIIHRDLTPRNIMLRADDKGNIMLRADDMVKIMDFGLAGETDKLSGSVRGVGTIGYMCLQQMDESSARAATDDIYSLGVILYEMLAGAHPFKWNRIEVLINQMMHTVPPTITARRIEVHGKDAVANRPPIPKHWETTIAACLNKDAAQRPQTMDAVRSLLQLDPQPPPPIPPSNSSPTFAGTVAAGSNHSLYVTRRGKLWAMGQNLFGELGDSSNMERHVSVRIASDVTAVVAGSSHSLYLTRDGKLWAMGYNHYGQLGNGSTTIGSSPVQIASNVTAMAAGSYHSLYVTRDGKLWAMGCNDKGQLGDGSTTDQSTPAHIASNVIAVAAGSHHSLYVTSDGKLWAAGWNLFGELGDGTTISHSTPVPIATNVTTVAAGECYSLYLTRDGKLWAMGKNLCGQLGNGSTASQRTPAHIASDVTAVAAGKDHSLYVTRDGKLWAMGKNANGQLGDDTTTDRHSPVQIASNVAAVAAGKDHSLYVTRDGKLWAMGKNANGQLGDGATTDRHTPVRWTKPPESVSTAVKLLATAPFVLSLVAYLIRGWPWSYQSHTTGTIIYDICMVFAGGVWGLSMWRAFRRRKYEWLLPMAVFSPALVFYIQTVHSECGCLRGLYSHFSFFAPIFFLWRKTLDKSPSPIARLMAMASFILFVLLYLWLVFGTSYPVAKLLPSLLFMTHWKTVMQGVFLLGFIVTFFWVQAVGRASSQGLFKWILFLFLPVIIPIFSNIYYVNLSIHVFVLFISLGFLCSALFTWKTTPKPQRHLGAIGLSIIAAVGALAGSFFASQFFHFSEDDAATLKWYREAAEQGDAAAQNHLGLMYDNGQGVPKDDAEAVKWFRKAADQGYALAQYNIGVMYANGQGVAKDAEESFKWYHKAADQGDADAQYKLGLMHAVGLGVTKDDTEAVKWFRKAADQKNADACIALGDCYADGIGVPTKDTAQARLWYQKAIGTDKDAKARQALRKLDGAQ